MSKPEQKSSKKTATRARKKTIRTIPVAIAYVKATFNNTIITITDPSGNVIAWSSAGKVNFSHSRKSSAFAATVAAQDAAKVAAETYGVKEIEVCLKGPGAGREAAVRALQGAGLLITLMRDATPVPHNGCRPRKRRRA